jgi:hypothetical protein
MPDILTIIFRGVADLDDFIDDKLTPGERRAI